MPDFVKMHGAGNDFIVLDHASCGYRVDTGFVKDICDRRRGVGADGLILLRRSSARVSMKFFNCDGNQADFCGNGLRCAALFAFRHMSASNPVMIDTPAGRLEALVMDEGMVKVQIPLLKQPRRKVVHDKESYFANTGVPHLILLCDDINATDLMKEGCEIRNSTIFAPEGTNVDFIMFPAIDGPVHIRTYERGVEGETSACGSGIAAAAAALVEFHGFKPHVEFITRGGDRLVVDIRENKARSPGVEIFLTGPAVEVFQGSLA